MILNYLGLVKYVTNRLATDLPKTIRAEDLVNAGVIGLIDAIGKFDDTRGIKFSTYAMSRIRGAVLDELRRLDWLPREMRRKVRELERVSLRLEEKISCRPTHEELAKELNITVNGLEELYRKISPASLLSLEELWYYDNGQRSCTRIERIGNEKSLNPGYMAENRELKKLIAKEIESLPEKERLVITLYYFEEMTLKEIGKVLELSESRVSQIHSKVILSLRKRIKKWKHFQSSKDLNHVF